MAAIYKINWDIETRKGLEHRSLLGDVTTELVQDNSGLHLGGSCGGRTGGGSGDAAEGGLWGWRLVRHKERKQTKMSLGASEEGGGVAQELGRQWRL